ncbi:hypothetical protein B0J11DRAFT_517230, partial [Dendryphion nanum]
MALSLSLLGVTLPSIGSSCIYLFKVSFKSFGSKIVTQNNIFRQIAIESTQIYIQCTNIPRYNLIWKDFLNALLGLEINALYKRLL